MNLVPRRDAVVPPHDATPLALRPRAAGERPPAGVRPGVRARRWGVSLAALCMAVLALGAAPALAQPHGRMDPSERQRLRMELREHAIEQRRQFGGRGAYAGPGWNGAPAYGTAYPPGAHVAPPPGAYAAPGGYPPPAAYAPPGPGGRLSPEERMQLRRQLRDARGGLR